MKRTFQILLALGFTLGQVITMCTTNPAKAIGEDHRIGAGEGRTLPRQARARKSGHGAGEDDAEAGHSRTVADR